MMSSRPTRRVRLLATASASVCGKGGSAPNVQLAGAGCTPAGNAEGAGGYGGASVLRGRSGPSGMALPRALPKEASQ